MPIYRPTAEQWEQYFPKPITNPESTAWSEGATAAELYHTRFVEATLLMTIDQTWPGLHALDDQYRIGSVQYSVGRWYIDNAAISCIGDVGEDFDIELDRVTETDWMQHLLEKNWFYDPTDFFDVLEEARRLTILEAEYEVLDALMGQEVQAMLQSGIQPFLPARMQKGQRVYIPTKMNQEERWAFAAFLAKEGYALG